MSDSFSVVLLGYSDMSKPVVLRSEHSLFEGIARVRRSELENEHHVNSVNSFMAVKILRSKNYQSLVMNLHKHRKHYQDLFI